MSCTTIENLPECLLVLILSFLPTIDAIRASIVCRRWHNLWHQIPSLSFDIVPFHSPPNSIEETRELFAKCVNGALSVLPFVPIHKFHLRFDCGVYFDDRIVDSWILHAINFKVSELDLDFDICGLSSIITEERSGDHVHYVYELDDYTEYCFDFSYLKNSSIKDLKLRRCSIDFPSSLCANDFASIRSIFLEDLDSLDSEVTHLVQNCVNLEHLSIQNSFLPKKLKVLSSKLKKCEFGFIFPTSLKDSSLEIHAPSLNSIIFDAVCLEDYLLKEIPNLVEAQVSFAERTLAYYGCWCDLMRSLNNIKYLTVQNMYFGQQKLLELFHTKEDALQFYKFNNLSHLELLTGYSETDLIGICSFLEYSPTLESITIDYCYPKDGEEIITDDFMSRSATLHIPRLRHVKMKNYKGSRGELYVVELLKIHQEVLEKVVAFPAQIGETKLTPYPLWTSSDPEALRGALKSSDFPQNCGEHKKVRRE